MSSSGSSSGSNPGCLLLIIFLALLGIVALLVYVSMTGKTL